MTFHSMLSKMRAALTKHGLLVPGQLATLQEGDLLTMITMARPGEEMDEEVRKDLLRWLSGQHGEARMQRSLQQKTEVDAWKERRYHAHRDAARGSEEQIEVGTEACRGDGPWQNAPDWKSEPSAGTGRAACRVSTVYNAMRTRGSA